ncbi:MULTISPECIES: hypothetical protein [unclassified Pseudomonas]|uniref:hypothetical protein n=1 Tax=unclassified Pseudomonas TaxID=196821 RepID=UPI001B342ED3|nr:MULTISPECIES: hypothetical protein [unclassified Pseudomonas]MBP5948519.1 hypothetical protein [Pseudomonas sp. P9(2020)]MBZ9560753.1 hypothetical protein [Pseudomonas sp. P116]
MTIDKQELQKLLWAEAASYRTDCADWKRNTEALQEFLGEKTVEEVALELLEENSALRSDIETWGLSIQAERNGHRAEKEGLQKELDRLKGPEFAEELAELRKDAERYRWLRDSSQYDWDVIYGKLELRIATSHYDSSDLGACIDAAMTKAVQP